MIKINKKLIGVLIIVGVISGAGVGYLFMLNFQKDSMDSMLITLQFYGAMSISISGIPDEILSYPSEETWYLDVNPYIFSPIIPIPFLSLSTNYSDITNPNVTIFNNNKTIKFYFDDSDIYGIRVSVSYFGIIVSDDFKVIEFL